MSVHVNGIGVRTGTITMPLVGAWHMSAVLDSDLGVSAGERVTVEIDGGAVLVGTVRRGGVATEIAEVQIVGGAGGMSNDIAPQHYSDPSARIVALDILAAAGETLSVTSDAALPTLTLPKWSRVASSCGAALDGLLVAIGMTWRVLDDGTVFIGTDTFAELVLPVETELIDEARSTARQIYADDTLAARPGRTINGVRAALVVHSISPDAFRTDVWPVREASRETSDPIRAAFTGAVQRIMRRVDYFALYPARVVSQSGSDLTLDVQPDRDTIPPMSKVPIRTFAPDIEIRLSPGARVLVGFEEGDPRKPYAALWQSGALTSIAIGGSTDAAALAALVLDRLTAIKTSFDLHTHSGVTAGGGVTGVPVAPLPSPAPVASTKLLLDG